MEIDKEKLLNTIRKSLGGNEQLENAVKNGSAENILNSLNPRDAARVSSILNDKQKLDELLKSDKARAILNQLLNGK